MPASVMLTVVSILAAASSKILADEFKAWRPRLTRNLLSLAVRRLPEERRERYHEEWLSYVEEIPGDIGKLFAALGLLRAGVKLGSMLGRQSRIEAVVKSLNGENDLLLQAGLMATPEDAWESLEGSKGLWAMYRNARMMLEMAEDAAATREGADRFLIKSIHSKAMQVRVCVLTALAQNRFERAGEGARINAFHAAQTYARLNTRMARLLKRRALS